MPRLLYATPTGKHPTVGYVISQRAVEMACRSFGVRHPRDFQFAMGPVQMARSEIAKQTLAGHCHVNHECKSDRAGCVIDRYDFVLMHDDDLAIYPQGHANPIDEFLAIFEADPTVGVVGALYLREKPLLVNLTVPHPRHPDELCHVIHGIPAKPFEAGGIATGFMMIRREVLEALGEILDAAGGGSMFQFGTYTTEWGTRYEVGEDYDFCKRVRALGWKVIADPRWKTTHIKDRGALSYDRDAWEAKWNGAGPASACIKELQEACPASYMIGQLPGGFVIIDHTDQRKLDAKAWQERRAKASAAPSAPVVVAAPRAAVAPVLAPAAAPRALPNGRTLTEMALRYAQSQGTRQHRDLLPRSPGRVLHRHHLQRRRRRSGVRCGVFGGRDRHDTFHGD